MTLKHLLWLPARLRDEKNLGEIWSEQDAGFVDTDKRSGEVAGGGSGQDRA